MAAFICFTYQATSQVAFYICNLLVELFLTGVPRDVFYYIQHSLQYSF
ncbi:hypothetical protein XNW1_2370007 [Xenorhabdus nematophila str. Websteri]|nr:hypothetical protein XNA1_290007 [Xenorhabdus nematophila str. Anatoliense]CEF30223.1 hypothetical protein XNW1_2370007 [Xenorhabdus nematophila str. Websteri]